MTSKTNTDEYETYPHSTPLNGRTLRDIDKATWECAHHLFQCIAAASRPLRVEEITGILALDFKTGPIPKFREDWCPEDPADFQTLQNC
jgi:hypothetical protein